MRNDNQTLKLSLTDTSIEFELYASLLDEINQDDMKLFWQKDWTPEQQEGWVNLMDKQQMFMLTCQALSGLNSTAVPLFKA